MISLKRKIYFLTEVADFCAYQGALSNHSELWLDRTTQRGPKRCLFSGSAYPVYGLHLFSNCFDKKIRCARIYGFLLKKLSSNPWSIRTFCPYRDCSVINAVGINRFSEGWSYLFVNAFCWTFSKNLSKTLSKTMPYMVWLLYSVL